MDNVYRLFLVFSILFKNHCGNNNIIKKIGKIAQVVHILIEKCDFDFHNLLVLKIIISFKKIFNEQERKKYHRNTLKF